MGKGRSGSNHGQTKKGKHSAAGARRPPAPARTKQELMRATNINATLVILRRFLSQEDMTSIRRLGPMGVLQNHDRSDELDYEHIVYRFEKALEAHDKVLHDRLLDAMFEADEEVWRGIPPKGTPARSKLHPEIEFISYDADLCARRGGRQPYIGPHVDNASAVTLIGQLSQFRDDEDVANEESKSNNSSTPKQRNGMERSHSNAEDRGYVGGYNRFEVGDADFGKDADDGGIANGRYREIRLDRGDVLMFRGEMVEHSLTPVTAGLRQIVQIELCREKEGRH